MKPQLKSDFNALIERVYTTHERLQGNAQKTVNLSLTVRNWLIGCYVVEYEQNGSDRAKYGTNLLQEIAKKIKAKGIRGLDLRTLRSCRTFYHIYPQIAEVIGTEFISEIRTNKQINSNVQIRGAVTPELKEAYITGDLLLSRLTFSHFVELIRVDNSLERLYYEVQAIKNNWSIRELERAITTQLALRSCYTKDRKKLIEEITDKTPDSNKLVMRNPYILEFLDLEEKTNYTENAVEQAILNNIQSFLMELGTGFCFEARQKRITFDNTHFYIDLVFYHKILKCNVLIELKRRKYQHTDAGQMNLYLNYYKDNEMSEGDNPPIGIILCKDKSDKLVEYSTAGIDNKLFVSKYLTNLPDAKKLEEIIKEQLD